MSPPSRTRSAASASSRSSSPFATRYSMGYSRQRLLPGGDREISHPVDSPCRLLRVRGEQGASAHRHLVLDPAGQRSVLRRPIQLCPRAPAAHPAVRAQRIDGVAEAQSGDGVVDRPGLRRVETEAPGDRRCGLGEGGLAVLDIVERAGRSAVQRQGVELGQVCRACATCRMRLLNRFCGGVNAGPDLFNEI